MKRLDHAYGYVVWPEWQEFSRVGQDISWEKSGKFKGKILLAH